MKTQESRLQQIRVELDRYNDEPEAYLTGWLFNEIDKFLKK